MIAVKQITLLRLDLEGTKDLTEKEIRGLSRGLFIRELWENDLITFNTTYQKKLVISIEIPTDSKHYDQEWMTPEKVMDHTLAGLHDLQKAIDEYNKLKSYIEIMRKAEGE